MKQVKHLSGFIYDTKYKSFLSHIKYKFNQKKTTTKNYKTFYSSNDLFLTAITASQILDILSTKDWQ